MRRGKMKNHGPSKKSHKGRNVKNTDSRGGTASGRTNTPPRKGFGSVKAGPKPLDPYRR